MAHKKQSKKKESIGQRAIRGLQEAHRHLRGEHVPGLVVHTPEDIAARKLALKKD